MFYNKKNVQRILYLIILSFLVLTFIGIIKTIFVSSDIDEGYAVTQAYRLIKGDNFLLDMWEPHQFSAYLPAVFMKIFIKMTGSTDYIVIFLRVIGTIIHIGLGIWLYKISISLIGNIESLFLTLLHVNFLAKWLQIPEFELMNYWYLLIVFLCFLSYYKISDKNIYLIISGICMMLQLFNYPTMIILYPFYMLGILKMRKDLKKEIVISTISAVIPGLTFIGYLFSYMNFKIFTKSLSYVMSDPSHMDRKFSARMLDFGFSVLTDIAIALFSFFVIFLIIYLITNSKNININTKEIIIITFIIDIIIYCIVMAYGCLLLNKNQFYLQSRYLIIAVLGIYLYYNFARKESAIYWFGIVPGFVAMIATLLVTNMTMNVAYSKLYICVIGCFLLLFMTIREQEKLSTFTCIISHISCIAVLMSLILCKLVLIRVTGCLPVTMNANLSEVEVGPLKGIYLVERTANTVNSNFSTIEKYVTEKDNLLYFGCENMIYLCTNANISAASVQGTSVFNEDFLDYFKEHPGKYPTVVAIDKNFSTDYYMVYNPYNYIMADWIENKFEYNEKIETDDMILYFK